MKALAPKASPAPIAVWDDDAERLYDAITLQIEKAESLMFLLGDRLLTLTELPNVPSELHGLSVVAESASDRMQLILERVHALRDHRVRRKTGGAR
jgi:hypothetical protein